MSSLSRSLPLSPNEEKPADQNLAVITPKLKVVTALRKETQKPKENDLWSDWLLHKRHADDSKYGDVVRSTVETYAERVLKGARLMPGMTMVDIGSGEGLIPFEAIHQIGPSLRVIITDISAPMLEYAHSVSVELGVESQCSFLQCSGDRLEGIPDESVDVVTTRASLAYVADKMSAFKEIFRILKPGGRISSLEPIFADESIGAQQLRHQVDLFGHSPESRLLKLFHRCKAAQFPDTEAERIISPHVNYSERDLFNIAQSVGFSEVHLEFTIDATKSPVTDWEVLLAGSPHPWAPSLGKILEEQFTPEDREFFEEACRPSVEAGQSFVTERNALITANKPCF